MEDKKNKSMLFRLFADNAPSDTVIEDEGKSVADSELLAQQDVQDKIATLLDPNAEVVIPEEVRREFEEAEAKEAAAREEQQQQQEEEVSAEGAPLVVDAKIIVSVSPDNMEAYIEAYAPRNGGEDANPRSIRAAITEFGVTTGIMDRALFDMAINRPYGKGKILVAKGTPKQDGVDAVVTEHFSRELNLKPFMNDDGTVDFKKLNIIREVKAGTVMVSVVPPTPGVEGVTVRGKKIPPRVGKPYKIMRGNNTTLSEDGLVLTATVDGHLHYVADRFHIETTFVVEGSVDNNTGNIIFCGDVLIKGDVREGYEIRSGGSIRVKGTVEGASIYAEKEVAMEGGFNGMKHGELSCKGNIHSKFLQNCNVYAKGNIVTEAIINSVVDCDSAITCTSGKGTVVGGKITALNSIEADTIGSDVNTPTNVIVGLSPTVIEEKAKLEKDARDIDDAKEAQRKNLIYLERCAKMGPLNAKNMGLLETCNKQKVILMMREGKTTKRLAEINTIIEEAATGSFVRAKVIYPSVKITIQSLSIMIKAVTNRAVIRREDGEVHITTY